MRSPGKEAIDTEKVGFATFRIRPHPFPRLHRHEEIEFNFLERGSAVYLHRNGKLTVPCRRLIAFWAAFPHRLVSVQKGTVMHVVNVPLGFFLQAKLPAKFTQSILGGEMIVETDPAQNALDLVTLNRWHADLQTDSAERRSVVELEMEVRLRRLALTGERLAAPPKSKLNGMKLGRVGGDLNQVGKAVQMALFMAENYQQSLHAQDVAAAVDLHPNYAMRLFRNLFGMHLHDYLINQRVAHAQRLIVTTDMKFLEIALESGFGSANRFYVTFQRVCGKTPRQYRRATATDACGVRNSILIRPLCSASVSDE